MLKPGDPAPPFELRSHTGERIRLSDFRGKKNVVVFFYPKDDTSGCTKEVCRFRDSYEQFTEKGAVVLGISSDDRDSHERFAGKYNLPFKLLTDSGGHVREAYQVPKTLGVLPGRVTFLVDKKGVIRLVFQAQFKPVQHVAEALAALERLGN